MKAEQGLIRSLTHGAVRFEENNGELTFSRFTEEQYRFYKNRSLMRAQSSAGIILEFETDAESFRFSGRVEPGSSRSFYWFDIFVNGFLYDHLGSECRGDQPDFSYEIQLKSGLKHVKIYFPGLSRVILKELTFSGESKVSPVKKGKTIICYGDSITQGYDARYAHLAYPNQLAETLDAEIINKAIGGEIFSPELALYPDSVQPDLITVAYGTNDWSISAKEEFSRNVSGFFRNLTRNYPKVPILVILPLWRIDCVTRVTACGSFSEMLEEIRRNCTVFPQIKRIDGLPLVPHQKDCFSPDGLHPNDLGFQFLGKNLLRIITDLKIF